MKEAVKNAIDRIYRQIDDGLYQEQSSRRLTLPDRINNSVAALELKVVEFYSSKKCWPCAEWDFRFPTVARGEFNAEFSTVLLVSKLAPFFNVQHEFKVENRAEGRISPLHGFFGQPFIQAQFRFDECLSVEFQALGYTRLTYAEMNEVVCDLSFPDAITIFGPQVTVQYALFHDLLGLCTRE